MIRGFSEDPLGARFHGCTFDTFQVTEGNKRALLACRQLVDGVTEGVVLTGPVGSGKTCLMASLAQAYSREEIGDINTESNIYCITQTRRDVEFWPILELVGRLRDEIRGGDYSVSRRCRECDLLIIDDFGEERVTDFVLEELERIIDSRYRDKRPIAVSTNLTTSQIIEKYGERAISRWSESCAVVALNGEDHRLGGAK